MRRLLEMSVDWLWALDAQCRLVDLTETQPQPRPQRVAHLSGRAPWSWPGLDAASAGRVRDMLRRREAIERTELRLRDRRGHWRHFTVNGEPIFHDTGDFAGFRGTARETTGRRRAEALLALEHTVTRELAEAATRRKVLQAVMRVICEAEDWETCGFFRVVDDQGTTCLEAGWSGPGTAHEAHEYYKATVGRLIPPGGFLSQVVASGKPRWVRVLRASQTTWEDRVRSTGERATLFTPMLVAGRVIGVFAFASRELREPDAALLQTMRVIGEQAGQFLQRKLAEQDLRESEARFRALTDLSSDWYWETDADLRVVRIDGRRVQEGDTFPGKGSLGRPVSLEAVCGDTATDEATWQEAMKARRAFRDVNLTHVTAANTTRRGRRIVSVSGEPMFDLAGRFTGYRGVGRDITAERQAQHARLEAIRLKAENAALQEGNRLKAAFLTNMSHELRTPLNAVLGFAQLLRNPGVRANDERADDYVKKIEVAGRDLLDLIQHLLDFAKAEAGRVLFQPEPTRLSMLIDDVVAALGDRIRTKHLAVERDLDHTCDNIHADPLRLKQVIEAYVSNAVKFTPVSGQIVIRTRAHEGDRFRLDVVDNGIGIAQGDLPKLFTAFGQLNSGPTRKHAGAGLGLAIARTLVEAQGGSVGVRSEFGKGSTFYFLLPQSLGAPALP